MNISNLILEIASKNSLLSDEDYTIIENNLEIIENLMIESQVSDSKEALNNLFKVFPIEDDYYSQTLEGFTIILRKNILKKIITIFFLRIFQIMMLRIKEILVIFYLF